MATITDFEKDYKGNLNEYEGLILDEYSDTDEIKDAVIEIEKLDTMDLADSQTEVYTSALLEWYSEDRNRLNYIDDAIDEGLTEGMNSFKLLMVGNFMYHKDKLDKAKDSLKDKLEEYESNLVEE